ncbi:hypothetical protein EsH8_I_001394 [Colletotrichum jinshuiense]
MADPLSIIASVIALLTAAEATYKGIRGIKRLPQAFQKLEKGLPLVLETLKEAKENYHPEDVGEPDIEALKQVVKTCEQKAEGLQEILKKLEPEDPASVRDKYFTIVKAQGKKARVEELMKEILESVHSIACHRIMKTATTAHVERLEAAIEDLKNLQSSDDEMHEAKIVQSINHGEIGSAYYNFNKGDHNKAHYGSGHIIGGNSTVHFSSSSSNSG